MKQKRTLVTVVIRLAAKQSTCFSFLFLLLFTNKSHLVISPYSENLPYQRAGLVVQSGDGSIETRCIQFVEESISGYELLVRSDIPFVAAFSSQGVAICKIEEDGCPEENCFCHSPPDYWSYWQLNEGEWVYSLVGASSSQVVDGDVEGWRWGSGMPPGKVIPFETICAQPSETPTSDYLTYSNTPTISPSPTFNNTSTPTPTVTKSPTPVSTYVWVAVPTNAPLVAAQLTTEITPTTSPTTTPSPVSPTSTKTPTPKPTFTSTASFTPTIIPSITATQTTQVSPTDTPGTRETTAPTGLLPSFTSQQRKTEITPTTTKRQGLQKSQSTPLALSPANAFTPQVEGAQSRPIYIRISLLTGGVISYLVFLFLFTALVIGLIIAWMVKR